MIPVLGNHDSAPSDYFPDSQNKSTPKLSYTDYITEGSFGDLLTSRSSPAEKFKECGYYVLRNTSYDSNVTQTFIVLNTALYYHNKAIDPIDFPADPCGQLSWLNATLSESKPKERIFIVAHVPPGYFEWHATQPMFSHEHYTKRFMDIVTDKQNAAKIVAHFYGHTHTDSFRILMDSKHETPVGIAFIAPSITPLVFVRNGVNPSFRIYDYDHLQRRIVNYNQFYLPLDKIIEDDEEYNYDEYDNKDYDAEEEESKQISKRQVNETTLIDTTIHPDPDYQEDVTTSPSVEEKIPVISELDNLVNAWTFGYNAATDYNLDALDIRGLHKVYSNMRLDPEGQAFELFIKHAFVLNYKSFAMECNATCHADVICTIAHITQDNFKDCLIEQGVMHAEELPTPPTPIQMTTVATVTTLYEQSTTSTIQNPSTASPKPSSTTLKNPFKNLDDPEISGHNSQVLRGVMIGLALVALVSMGILGLFLYKRMQRRRYCSQEFLLDSFRHDGYSQLNLDQS